MAKGKKELVQGGASKRNILKSAVLPWAIIVLVSVAGASFVSGWHLSQAHSNSIKAQVMAEAKAVTELKTQE